MKTYSTKMGDVTHAWHVLDATDQPLGRLATQAAALLRGKHKPIYTPNLPVGDFVVIVNAEKVRVTGNKAEGKIYYRHTQYPGGLRQTTFRHQMEKFPARAVEKAIKGMLPHNRLGRKLFTRLKVYAGPQHPHGAQVTDFAKPETPKPAKQRAQAVSPAVEAPEETTAATPVAAETAVPEVAAAPPSEAVEASATEAQAVEAPAAEATATEAATEAPAGETPAEGATEAVEAPETTIAATDVPEESPDTPGSAPAKKE